MNPERVGSAEALSENASVLKDRGGNGFGLGRGAVPGAPSPLRATALSGIAGERGTTTPPQSIRRDGAALRVLLADDHHIVRQGIEALLEREGFSVVGKASDGLEAVRLAHQFSPDVAVLDLAMPLLNGIAAAREILRNRPEIRPILLTMYTEDIYVLEALRAGIRGYILKTQLADDLLGAIQAVTQGRVYLSPAISDTVVQACLGKGDLPPDSLSPREAQVLQLVAEGKSTKETAGLLGVSSKTVESHRQRIMAKLDIHDVPGLVRHAIRRGLVQP
jgi:DNA-binding NarL/FixJ family response regulator